MKEKKALVSGIVHSKNRFKLNDDYTHSYAIILLMHMNFILAGKIILVYLRRIIV